MGERKEGAREERRGRENDEMEERIPKVRKRNPEEAGRLKGEVE